MTSIHTVFACTMVSVRRTFQSHAQLRHHLVNDSWMVPYNPHLLMKFNCHMNVEICSTVKSVKYIFKHIHKGNDCAHVEIKENTLHHDEILQYLNARYVGPHQAMFRIMQYKMHDKCHHTSCSASSSTTEHLFPGRK